MKSKKKIYKGPIKQLNSIETRLRDFVLSRYIDRCKRVHAMVFFQWRAKF